MSLSYTIELLRDTLDEMIPLLRVHFEEVQDNLSAFPFNPDYERYLQMEQLGMLHVACVRDQGVLIGYGVYLLTEHIHSRGVNCASNSAFYVKPEYRHTGVSHQLIVFAEGYLKTCGASLIVYGMKCGKTYESLCRTAGYTPMELHYSKYVGD